MKNCQDYYRLLHVQPEAPPEVIRASFRTLMLELKRHPDLGGSNRDASLLNEAYEVLSNPRRRSAYDQQRSFQSQPPERPQPSNPPPRVAVFCPLCKQELAQKPPSGSCCASCHNLMQRLKAAKGTDKRTLPRMEVLRHIVYYTSWPGEPKEADMIDFSPKGMRFITSEWLIPGEWVKIASSHFRASARVTNVREKVIDGKKLWSAGVSFLAISIEEEKGFMLHSCA
jgi:curved DNA-binding protein CbpA